MEIINPSGKKTFKLETDFCGRKLGLEVNRVGFRTTSSVLVTYGDTVVLGSVVVGTKPVVQDFFPLSIDYEEKYLQTGIYPYLSPFYEMVGFCMNAKMKNANIIRINGIDKIEYREQ